MSSSRKSSRGGSQSLARPGLQGTPSDSKGQKREREQPGPPKERIRTGHACEPCRHRRAKCNGVQPRCGRCEELNLPCFYAESKAQRHHREKVLSTKAATYEALLQSLLPNQEPATQQQILAAINDDYSQHSGTRSSGNEGENVHDENSVPSGVGAPVLQDETSKMFKSEGYLGKSSSSRWISDIGEKFNRDHISDPAQGDRRAPGFNPTELEGILIDAANYHVSEFEDDIFANLGSGIDVKALPPKWEADEYIRSYMETVQPMFHVISKEQFLQQYESFWATGIPPDGDVLWQANLYLILALGCLRGRYTGAQPEPAQDAQFFLRARVLSLEPLNLLQMPQRSHVQLAAMFAMYLLASNRVNRAWQMIGTSVRYAQSLGFHLTNADGSTPAAEKELQKRIWHSVSTLEHFLCFLTGRPLAIQQTTVSVGLPKSATDAASQEGVMSLSRSLNPRPPDKDVDGLEVFRRSILLDRILSEALNELYSAGAVRQCWTDIQHTMANLNIRLTTWKAYLPDRYGLKDIENSSAVHLSLDATYLALRFFSTIILINRLSLCYLQQHMDNTMPDQSERSRQVDVDNAGRAVSSSRRLIQILYQRNRYQLYLNTPWWCVLHLIVQSCAVLIMETMDASRNIRTRNADIIRDAQNGIEMLERMQESNPAAEKACSSLSKLLTIAVVRGHHMEDSKPQESAHNTPQGQSDSNPTSMPLYPSHNNILTFDMGELSRVWNRNPTHSLFFNYGPFSGGSWPYNSLPDGLEGMMDGE